MRIVRLIQKSLDPSQLQPLSSPMLFLTGPRQVGKTSLVRELCPDYYNWDVPIVKKQFIKNTTFFRERDQRWIVFDEIHKRRNWKSLMKGFYDDPDRNENFLVTGSGRFNLYQKGGDSLQGRYQLFHLFPLLLTEATGDCNEKWTSPINFSDWSPKNKRGFGKDRETCKKLLNFGGFPEPFLKGTLTFLNRWMDLYIQRLVQEDVRDFSQVSHLDKLEMLMRILPSRVMSPISYKSLSEDVEVSPDTIKDWLRLLEILYFGFLLKPFTRKIHRTVKKEPKWYFFQWTYNETESALFENFVATQLYTLCHYWRDQGHGVYELFYLRDQDRREVDFVITKNLKPQVLIEAKLTAEVFPSPLNYYAEKLSVPAFVVTRDSPTKSLAKDRWITSMDCFFS